MNAKGTRRLRAELAALKAHAAELKTILGAFARRQGGSAVVLVGEIRDAMRFRTDVQISKGGVAHITQVAWDEWQQKRIDDFLSKTEAP